MNINKKFEYKRINLSFNNNLFGSINLLLKDIKKHVIDIHFCQDGIAPTDLLYFKA